MIQSSCMAEDIPHASPPKEQDPESILQLAKSWLAHRRLKLNYDRGQTERSIQFNRSYEPKIPSMPAEGPGSADWQDYQTELGEAQNWPWEQEAELLELERDLGDLELNKKVLQNIGGKVENGDLQLIRQLADLELTRRAKLEEEKRFLEERKGLEFERSQEIFSEIKKVWGLVQKGQVPPKSDGPTGWQLDRNWGDTIDFDYKHEAGPFKRPIVSLRLKKEGNGFTIDLSDLTNVEEDPTSDGKRVKNPGVHYEFHIEGNIISNQGILHAKPDREHGYYDMHIYAMGRPERFTPIHLNQVRPYFNSLLGDIQSLASK